MASVKKEDSKVAEGRSPHMVETNTSEGLLNQPTVHLSALSSTLLLRIVCCYTRSCGTNVVASFHGVEHTRLSRRHGVSHHLHG